MFGHKYSLNHCMLGRFAFFVIRIFIHILPMGRSRGWTGGLDLLPLSRPPMKNHKKYRVSKQYWSDPSHKATKPAFNVGPSSTCKRNPT